jgi:Protein of unknown function (DUF4065)
MKIYAHQLVFNPAKFKELMLYAAEKSSSDDRFGATKLNKILFFSDFLFFGMTGSPITGATYQKLKNGPTPTQLKPTAREIENDGSGVFVKRAVFNYTQTVLVPKRPANRRLFTAEEIDLVDDVIRDLAPRNAKETSELSHARSAAWQVAELNEEIPYEAVFLSARKATSIDIQRGQELARKYGWVSAGR